MSDIQLTIDGKKVTVAKGTTIIEAARKAGIEIPHLCYGGWMIPSGDCRLCVVEVAGSKKLAPSCVYPAANNMVVMTSSERVIKARKMVIELLLSDHPFDCMTCEKSGSCRLEKYAYELGVSTSRFKGEKHNFKIDESNPFFTRDYNKCILCERCVKACSDVQFVNAIDVTYRGFKTKVATPYDRPLQDSPCIFCGQCIAVCPTGALTEKARKGKGREWELKKVETVCPYCGVGCNLQLNVKGNQIVKVTSALDSVVNKGRLCAKGRFGFDFVHSRERLTKPLIRVGEKGEGKFRDASWEEVLDLVANKFNEIKKETGPDSLAFLASAKCTNEENFLMQKLARAAAGTNNIDHCARLCHAPSVVGLAATFGSGAMTNSIHEIRHTDCIFIIGSNTSESHPIIGIEVMEAVRNGKAKLIVADPRKIRMVEFAHLWLRQKPGSDVALVNGLVNIILSEGWQDTAFINARTEGFEAMVEAVKEYTPEVTSKITGVPVADLKEAARLYAKAGNAFILYSMGITQHTTGTENVMALANLVMVTGNIGREGAGMCPLRGQNNVQGSCDMGGLPNVLPGYQAVINSESRKKFEKHWKVTLPDKVGLTMVEMMNAIAERKIRGMYILGEDPVLADPNSNHVIEALKSLDLLVVQDILPSETVKLADVVLPGVSFAEKDGTFTNTERRVQLVRKAIEPPGEARQDWMIISDIATRMGYPMKYASPAHIMEEISLLAGNLFGGVNYERLEGNGLQWPCTSEEHPGTPYLHKDQFTCGLGQFKPVKYKGPYENPDEEYPFVLSTGRMLFHWHGGNMSRHSVGLDKIKPEADVEINPVDAKKMSAGDGDLVEMVSRRGKIVTRVKVTDRSPEGVAFMTFHFKEAPVNRLTLDVVDPLAKIPSLKVCSVRINPVKEKAGGV
ncbi:MAG TPA: formate dehydrogenase subunit alpha [Dehalococcoidales bacterium]|nr:formate dehydrogenase subunit alpha [Dehalococcoidales bacterium]